MCCFHLRFVHPLLHFRTPCFFLHQPKLQLRWTASKPAGTALHQAWARWISWGDPQLSTGGCAKKKRFQVVHGYNLGMENPLSGCHRDNVKGFGLGFPILKMVIILVVTGILGRGTYPRYNYHVCKLLLLMLQCFSHSLANWWPAHRLVVNNKHHAAGTSPSDNRFPEVSNK